MTQEIECGRWPKRGVTTCFLRFQDLDTPSSALMEEIRNHPDFEGLDEDDIQRHRVWVSYPKGAVKEARLAVFPDVYLI
jgi:hypothetical protein